MTHGKHGNPRSRRTTASSQQSVQSRAHARRSQSATRHAAEKARSSRSADYEDLKRTSSDFDVYSQISGSSYLDSDSIRAVRKKRKRRKILTGVCVSLLVVLLVGAGAAFAYVSKIGSNITSGLDSALLSALSPTDTPEDPFYMLLMGVDSSSDREASNELDGTYRSDSMMLARIDPKQKKATLLSIPRDSKVEIGSHGTNKINAAHAFGGPALAVETVSKLCGVPIAHYAEINFDGFIKVINALGGIEVDVPIEIDDWRAGGYVPAGRQVLDGDQALIFARSRHSYDDYGDGDIYRSANQRVVLSAVAQKLLASDALTIAGTLQAISECVMTDMSLDQIIGLAQSMQGMNAATDIYTGTIPTESEYRNNIWYEVVDESELKKIMKRVDAGLPPAEEDEIDDATGTVISSTGSGELGGEYSVDRTATIRIRNGNGRDGVCAEAEAILEGMGYRKFDTGNANNFDYPTTEVVYKDDKNAEFAKQMVSALGVGEAKKDDGDYLFESDFLVIIGDDWQS